MAALAPYMSQVGAGVLIQFDVAHSVTLNNTQLNSLHSGHFDLL
jgi:hypothetical protein